MKTIINPARITTPLVELKCGSLFRFSEPPGDTVMIKLNSVIDYARLDGVGVIGSASPHELAVPLIPESIVVREQF